MSQLPLRLKMGHLKHFLIIALLFCFTLFGFQNCSSPVGEGGEFSSIAQNAPWAFDATVDTIAHMSCGGMINGYDQEAYFSFAGGSFQSGSGLKFTDEFIDFTGGLSPSSRQSLLSQSNLHDNAKFQVAVRSLSDIKAVLGTLNEGFAYGSYSTPLTNSSVSQALPQSSGTTRVNSFGGEVLAAKNNIVAGSTATTARTQLNSSSAVLGFTFSNSSTQSGGVGPSADRAYGRGFVLSFVNPSYISTSGATTQIGSATEYNLENGNLVGSNWSCSSNLRYLIVRQQDIGVQAACGGNANLTPGVEEVPANQTQANELAELRKFLPVSKWGIDLANRCIVPKNNVAGSCYGNSNVIRYPGNGSVCSMGLNTCPHYVSICQRN